MKVIVITAFLFGAGASASQAQEGAVLQNPARPVRGIVIVEEIPTVVVEGRRYGRIEQRVIANRDAAATPLRRAPEHAVKKNPEYAVH